MNSFAEWLIDDALVSNVNLHDCTLRHPKSRIRTSVVLVLTVALSCVALITTTPRLQYENYLGMFLCCLRNYLF